MGFDLNPYRRQDVVPETEAERFARAEMMRAYAAALGLQPPAAPATVTARPVPRPAAPGFTGADADFLRSLGIAP